MASTSYSNSSNAGLTSRALVTSTISESVWTTIFNIIQMYAVPVFMVMAIIGNALIILITLTVNTFSLQTSITVRSYYVAFAVADLVTVIFYNLPTWLGMSTFLKNY